MGHMESLRFETEEGEMVRSKSEVIIANMYLMNDCEVVYTYESGSNLLEIRTVKKIIQDML